MDFRTPSKRSQNCPHKSATLLQKKKVERVQQSPSRRQIKGNYDRWYDRASISLLLNVTGKGKRNYQREGLIYWSFVTLLDEIEPSLALSLSFSARVFRFSVADSLSPVPAREQVGWIFLGLVGKFHYFFPSNSFRQKGFPAEGWVKKLILFLGFKF